MTTDPVFTSWDDVAAWLREERSRAGSPVYAELARGVERVRAERGEPSRPPRSTVFDCFKAGRRRMDVGLLTDLARAMGVEDDRLEAFRRACTSVQDRTEAARVVTVSDRVAATTPFVGRDAELSLLAAAPEQVWVISGMPGVGKTQLVARAVLDWLDRGTYARALVAHLRGFHPTRPPAEGLAVLDELLRLLTGTAAARLRTPQERRRLLRDQLVEQRCVLVLDDAGAEDQVDAIIDPKPGTGVLVTSRRDLARPDVGRLPLAPHGEQDSVELLRQVTSGTVVESDPDAARDVVTTLGGLALAVELTGRRIATTPGWSLRDHSDALVRSTELRRLPGPLSETLELSYERLPSEAARVLRLLADQPCRALPPDAVAAVAGLDQTTTTELLHQLSDTHLVTRSDRGVGLHDVVRVHAAGHLEDEDAPSARDAARGRLLDHYSATLRTAVTASGGLAPNLSRRWFEPLASDWTKESALAWLAAERENLLALSDPASCRVRPDFLLQVTAALSRLVDTWALFTDGLTLSRRLARQARDREDPAVGAVAELLLASNLVRLGRSEEADAHLDRAADLVDRAEDPDTWVNILNTRAIRAHYAGHTREALDLMTQALAVVDAGGTTRTPAMLLGNIGAIHFHLGDSRTSSTFHERAAREAEEEGDLQTASVALSNLGQVYVELGEHERALGTALQARDIAERMESRLTLVTAHTNLGTVLSALGRHDEAREAHRRALALTTDSGERHQHASVLNDLGDTERASGDSAAAREAYAAAAALADELDDPGQAGRAAEGLSALEGATD